MKFLLSLSLLIILTGCTGQARLVKALAKDPAIVSAKIVTPWGNASLVRVGSVSNSVTVTPDGAVTVKP